MKEHIEYEAKKLIKKYNTRNPFELAERMNIAVKYYDFKKLEIKQQLCCGHEIGHDQLHRHLTYYMKDYDLFTTNSRTEYQANLMAAHILVPDELLDKYYNSLP